MNQGPIAQIPRAEVEHWAVRLLPGMPQFLLKRRIILVFEKHGGLQMYRRVIDYIFYGIFGLQVACGILLINRSDLLFSNSVNLYGPLRNNLLFVIVYVTLGELMMLLARYKRNGPGDVLLMGIILALTVVGMEFYSSVNAIGLNGMVVILGLMFAICHFGYGIFLIRANQRKARL